MVTHMGRGVLSEGQPRHCICTNASRGFSETAEFIVLTSFLNSFVQCHVLLHRRNVNLIFIAIQRADSAILIDLFVRPSVRLSVQC